jgi:putative hemolysin
MLLFITAVATVLVVSFLCSIFESVLLSLTRPQIEVLGRNHRRASLLLASFKDNIDVPIAAILVLNTAAHTIGAAVAGASYSSVFNASTLWVFSILFTIAVLFFTEIIPKTLGVSYAQQLAVPVAHGIRWLTIMLKPLVAVSERLSRSLRRDTETPVTSAEEIRLLAALGRSAGAVGARTAQMVVGATQLGALQAHDAMLPRDAVHFLSPKMSREEVLAYIRETGHSRFPFSPTGELDAVTGVIFVKELLDWVVRHEGAPINWDELFHEVLIVPESLPLPRLLKTFQDSHRHLAVVVDEYGAVLGVVTLEDVLEEIVGDIRDESDAPSTEYLEETETSLVVRADVDLRRISAKLGIAWEPDPEVTTGGGLVIEALERIPVPGDAIEWKGFRIEVLRADRRRARLLKITKA